MRQLVENGCVVVKDEPEFPRTYVKDPFGLIYNLSSLTRYQSLSVSYAGVQRQLVRQAIEAARHAPAAGGLRCRKIPSCSSSASYTGVCRQ